MRPLPTALILLILLTAGAPALARAQAPPETSSHWRAMARADLAFIRRTIGEHHPGPLDTANAAFGQWHEQGYRESLALLDRVTSYGGYRSVLQRYVAGFRDGHLNLNLSLDYRWAGWPRFTVAWRDGAIVVRHAEPGLEAPAPGDRLLSCDGIPAETLYRDRVHPFAGQGIPADRYRHTPDLLRDRVSPLVEDLDECTFDRDGEPHSVALDWRWVPRAELDDLGSDADDGPARFEGREVAGGGLWIRLPTFGPRGEDLDAAQAIFAALPDQRDRPFIILDVRGNGGGSSFWAGELVRQLYGPAWLTELERKGDAGAYPTHRVSADNLTHFRDLLPRIAEQAGEDSRFHRSFAALADRMARALEEGVEMMDFHGVDDGAPDDPDSGGLRDETAAPVPENAGPLYSGRLILLTDPVCASACLDFADVILALPDVLHLGQPTGADTNYMEIRGLALPSRNGRLNFATKVYRNRQRGHNEWYEPDVPWPGDRGDLGDDEAVETWVVEVVDRRH